MKSLMMLSTFARDVAFERVRARSGASCRLAETLTERVRVARAWIASSTSCAVKSSP